MKRLLAALARSDSGARGLDGQFLRLAVADIAQYRDHFMVGWLLFTGAILQRAAAHLRPDEAAGMLRIGLAADAEFERALFVARGGIGKRSEVGRAIGDMDAVEQAIAQQLVERHAEQRLGRWRDKQHGAVAAMAHDDIRHVAGEQPVAVFLGVQHPEAGARELLGARTQGRSHRVPPG